MTREARFMLVVLAMVATMALALLAFSLR